MLRKTSSWFTELWTTDRGLSVFLVILLLFLFVMPLFKTVIPGRWPLLDILFFLLLMTGILSVSQRRWQKSAMGAIVAVALLVRVAQGYAPGSFLAMLKGMDTLAPLALFTLMILARVFRSGPVTRDRILGAVAAYLLFGLTWASAYHLLAIHLPGAFSGAAPDPTDPWPTWSYFSFVTLTTVGYGDITPVAMPARSLAIMEALTGQLYPAILLARLVSMELLTRTENPAANDPGLEPDKTAER